MTAGGEWVANGPDCKVETKGENLIWINGDYVCTYCEGKKYAHYDYDYKDSNRMEPCVYCGDFESVEDMFLLNGYKICTHCNDYEKSNKPFTL